MFDTGSFEFLGLFDYVLGDVLLRNIYAIFDMGNGTDADKQFGFVPRASELQSASLDE